MNERQIPTEQQRWFMAAIASVAADLLAFVIRNRTLQLLFTLLGSTHGLLLARSENLQIQLFEKTPLTDQVRIYPLLI